jgi:hypothetical protein
VVTQRGIVQVTAHLVPVRAAFLRTMRVNGVLAVPVGVPWLVPAVVVPPTAAALLLLPPGPVRTAGWTALALACALLVVTARWQGARHPWRWVGAGLVLLALSGAMTAPAVESRLPETAIAPSVVVHLLAYLPLLVGVFRLSEPTPRRADRWVLLDALVVVIAVVAVGLLVAVDGRVDGLPLLVLPVLDLTVLASAMPLLGPAGRGPAQVMVAVGLTTMLVTDGMLLIGAATGLETGVAAAGTMLLTLVLLAVAARHPSASRLAEAAQDRARARTELGGRTSRVSGRRLLLLTIGLVGAPCVLLLGLLGLLPETARLVPLAAFAVFALAAVRLAHLVAELVRHEAEQDAQRRFTAAFDRSPGGLGLVALTGTGRRPAGRGQHQPVAPARPPRRRPGGGVGRRPGPPG